DRALVRAAEIDRDRERWRDAPLAGVTIALKATLCTRGVRTTAGSKILESFVPPYDATVVTRLERAGAIVVGKTNCDEFAMGSSTENSAFGPTRNPWALDRTPGGSSGGSAAAVAAGLAPVALGSDTGGSIRQPAAMCGIVGLKPSYGRVSRYGLIAFGSSLDQIGPLAHEVADAALLLEVIAGHDARDATSVDRPVPAYRQELERPLTGLTSGGPGEDYDAALKECDLIAGPASPTVAFRLGERSDPLAMYLADVYTISANLAGLPAISVPCGFNREGLPIGLQLQAAPFEELKLLQAAR